MIAPRTTPQVAPVEWWYDLEEERDDTDVETLELEAIPREEAEDEGGDDEIARAAEELRADEG